MQGEVKEYARYLLEDLEDGKIRNFDSRSGKLAQVMAKVKPGQQITINRTGEGFETKYKVETQEGEIKEDYIDEDDIPVIEDE